VPVIPVKTVRPGSDRGSMSVEFIIAGPLLVALLLLIAFAGQWFNNTSQVGAAARDAARTASNIVSWDNVYSTALSAADLDLKGACAGNPSVTVNAPAAATWANAQQIEVTVSCTVPWSVFNYIGIGGSHTFTAVAYAPLDPYSYRVDG
jgi:Flp pilus assembly protein TadG